MSANNPRPNPNTRDNPRRSRRDVPGCIKYIILLFLLLLLFGEYYAGEFKGFPRVSWIIWLILFIKLLLILLLICLIRVQRKLNCNIATPSGCSIAEYDQPNDMWFIRVTGTASGTVFGDYTLTVERPPGSFYPATIIYPGGGSSGTTIVNGGELGRIDVTYIEPAPMRVILTVNPSGAGSSCTDDSHFDWANRNAYIDSVGAVAARYVGNHPVAVPTEPLKLVTGPPIPAPPGPDEVSVGGGITVEGTADYTGCGREMFEYLLQHRSVAEGDLPWSMVAPGPWSNILAPLPFGDPAHPRTFHWLVCSTWYNTVRTISKLTRVWSIAEFLMTFSPITTAPRPFTQNAAWDTRGLGLNGRYTVRLIVKHQPIGGPPPPAEELYDSATVWIDNRDIEGRITGMAVAGGGTPFSACEELSLSQFVTPGTPSATSMKADIRGRAWDPVILNSYVDTSVTPHTTIRPNNNFGHYSLTFKKDGSITFNDITPVGGINTRVPSALQQAPLTPFVEPLPPIPPDTGSLALWDIVKALDAGPRPDPMAVATYPKIFRGDRCAYLIKLHVEDTTRVGDSGTHHHIDHDWPFCIMNDIPNNVMPNATTTPWP